MRAIDYSEFTKMKSTDILQKIERLPKGTDYLVDVGEGNVVSITFVSKDKSVIEKALGKNYKCTASKTFISPKKEFIKLAKDGYMFAGLSDYTNYGDRRNADVYLLRLGYNNAPVKATSFGGK